MLRIIYPQPGGPIAVITPVQVEAQDGETAEEALLRHARGLLPEGTPVALVDADAIPADRTWRNAWSADFASPYEERSQVTVDMDLAREIHRDRVRAARAPLLATLDADFMQALEAGDEGEKAQIAARKQMLRDAPATEALAKATTPEALIASIPDDELRERYARFANVAKGGA